MKSELPYIIKMLCITVHPDIGYSHQIAADNISIFTFPIRESVGKSWSKNVPNTRTWQHFDCSTTHPDLETYLSRKHSGTKTRNFCKELMKMSLYFKFLKSYFKILFQVTIPKQQPNNLKIFKEGFNLYCVEALSNSYCHAN